MKAIKLCLLLCCVATLSWGQVRITEVNTTSGDITLTNMGGGLEDVTSWWLCYFPAYDQLSSLPLVSGSLMLMPGNSVTVTWSDAVAATGECGLYDTNTFTSSTAMQDYMEWEAGGNTREPVAVAAGVWCAGEFVTGTSPYTFTGGATDYCSTFWTGTVISGCTDSTFDNYNPAATVDDGSCGWNVTFSVDMNNYVPAFGYVNVSGEWNGWCGDCNQLTDADLDGVWEATFPIPDGNYKFKYSVDNWTDNEPLGIGGGWTCTVQQGDFINRDMTVSGAGFALGTVCWNSCLACAGAGVPGCTDAAAQNYNSLATEADGTCQYLVTFQVNMANYPGAFGAAEVNGAFNGWCGNCNAMADADLDDIWDVQAPIQEGWYEYKYSLDAWTDQESLTPGDACVVTNFGNTNRHIAVTGDVVLPVVCWHSCADCVANAGCTDSAAVNYDSTAVTDDGSCVYAVTFMVDMNQVGGGFTLPEVNGSFDAWTGGVNTMTDADLDGVWEATVNLGAGAHEFKFAADNWAIDETMTEGDPCTVNAAPFVNRLINVTGPMTYGPVCYGSCNACGISDVTFAVDMNNYVPAFGYVNVSGEWNGWCGDCNQLTDADLDGVWEVTLPIPDGDYLYKFSLDNWAAQEALVAGAGFPCVEQSNDNINRTLTVAGNTDQGVVCWESCQACAGAGVPGCMDAAAQNFNSLATESDGTCEYLVTFQVNMNNEVGFTTPEVNGVFNGWCGNCNAMTDANVDGIWDVQIQLQEGWYEYKYSADAWGSQETLTPGDPCVVTNFGNTNRFVQVTGDSVLPSVCWHECIDCVAGAGCTDPDASNYDSAAVSDDGSCVYAVTFMVDMNQVVDPFTTPEVNGTFNGWTGGVNTMTDADLDGVWEVTIDFPAGGHEFKFAADSWAIDETLTEGAPCTVGAAPFVNRLVTVVDAPVTVGPVCWASCNACGINNVTFRVDMNNYVPAFGYVNVSGAWNGWCGDCNQLTDADLDGIWEVTLPIPDGDYHFKYSLDNWAAQENLAVGGGFPCTEQEGDNINRVLSVAGADVDMGTVCWESCYACPGAGVPGCMDPAAQNYNSLATEADGTCQYLVTFQVNMANYGGAFGATEVNGAFNGWCGNCNAMSDADLDDVWDVQIQLQEGWYEYKYSLDAWADQEALTPGSPCTVTNFGNTNRGLQVTGDAVLPVVCWNSCSDCVTGAGCMDSTAANYDSTAVTDDGSCEYLVDFSVDMNQFGGGFTGVSVFATFNGWDVFANPLADGDLDGVWTGTVQILNGMHEFKYAVDGPPGQENFTGADPCVVGADPFWNRWVDVTGNITLATVCYDSCDACPASGCTDPTANNYDSTAAADDGSCMYDVIFTVDMNDYGTAGVDYTTPEVNGSFNGWCGGCAPMFDPELDGVWTLTISLPAGNHEYKFAVDSWTDQEFPVGPCMLGANRLVVVTTATDIGEVCWGSCFACSASVGCTDPLANNYDSTAASDDGSCTYDVIFTVDMNTYGTAGVDYTTPEVNGGFNGWCGGCNPMVDPELDGIWTATLSLPAGTHEYQFAVDGWADQEFGLDPADPCTLGANRFINVTGPLDIGEVCWESCDACPISGCTDPAYVEFDPYASIDDGSCVTLVVEGCIYDAATNYDSTANTDDGSCLFDCTDPCPGDFDGNLQVNTADLLQFLTFFGTTCN